MLTRIVSGAYMFDSVCLVYTMCAFRALTCVLSVRIWTVCSSLRFHLCLANVVYRLPSGLVGD